MHLTTWPMFWCFWEEQWWMGCGWDHRVRGGAELTTGGSGDSLQGPSDSGLASFATSPSTSSFQGDCGLNHMPAGNMGSHQTITWYPLCLELHIQEHGSKDNIVVILSHSPALSTRISRNNEVYGPAILLRGVHPRELKTYTQMLTAVLFITAKKWKQSKCSSTDECINKCGMSIHWNIIQHKRE